MALLAPVAMRTDMLIGESASDPWADYPEVVDRGVMGELYCAPDSSTAFGPPIPVVVTDISYSNSPYNYILLDYEQASIPQSCWWAYMRVLPEHEFFLERPVKQLLFNTIHGQHYSLYTDTSGWKPVPRDGTIELCLRSVPRHFAQYYGIASGLSIDEIAFARYPRIVHG